MITIEENDKQLMNQQLNLARSTSDPCVVAFDLAVEGHHPTYIRHLVDHWYQEQLPGTLHVLVSPMFIEQHPDTVSMAFNNDQSRICFTAITSDEYAQFKEQSSLIAQSFTEWNLFCRYASQLQATYGILMYFDSLQIPLLLGKKSPCPVAGIYFRPTFHYGEFVHCQPTLKDKFRQYRQKLLLRLILLKSQVNTLFCLDPFVVKWIEQFCDDVKVLPLADPVQPNSHDRHRAEQLRQELKIDSDRKVFLLFGELSERKGIYQVFEAIRVLSLDESQHVCLLLAGATSTSEQAVITTGLQQTCEDSEAQVILCDRYIKEEDVQHYFELADVVLATYQRHVGMSSILLHAAAAKKPVIASDFGLMGELVRHYQLGLAIDASDPGAIAKAIKNCLSDAIKYDLNQMERLVQQNLVDKFVQTITAELLAQSSTESTTMKL